jgi:hypothetical protein
MAEVEAAAASFLLFSIGLSPPPQVEDPDRFYRSDEKNIGNSPGKPQRGQTGGITYA